MATELATETSIPDAPPKMYLELDPQCKQERGARRESKRSAAASAAATMQQRGTCGSVEEVSIDRK